MPAIAARLQAPSSTLQTSALTRADVGQSAGAALSITGSARLRSLLPTADMPDSFAQAAVPRSAVWRPMFPDSGTAMPPTKITAIKDVAGVTVQLPILAAVPPTLVPALPYMTWRGVFSGPSGQVSQFVRQSMGGLGTPANGNNQTMNITFASPVAPGAAILVLIFSTLQTVTTFTVNDTFASAYKQLRAQTSSAGAAPCVAAFLATKVTGGTCQISSAVTPGSGGTGQQVMYALELTQAVTGSDSAASDLEQSFGTPPVSLSASQAIELGVMMGAARIANTFTPTPASGFTNLVVNKLGGGGPSDPSGLSSLAVNAALPKGTSSAGFLAASNPDAWGIIAVSLAIGLAPSPPTYKPFDVVEFNNQAYVCVSSTSSSPLQDPTSWIRLAAAEMTTTLQQPAADTLAAAGIFATTVSIPGNSANPGDVFEIWADGIETVAAGHGQNYNLALNSTNICPASGFSVTTGTNQQWKLYGQIIVLTTGSTGTVMCLIGLGQVLGLPSDGNAISGSWLSAIPLWTYTRVYEVKTTIDFTVNQAIGIRNTGNGGGASAQLISLLVKKR